MSASVLLTDSDTNLPIGSEEKILALRHHMHRHPELSNQEFGTQRKICDLLEAEGLSYSVFHETGVWVDVVGTGSGPGISIAVRGDIDALPIVEARSDLSYCSERPGLMHACGHDVHSATAYGVVLAALAHQARFAGTVRVIFQPAEEAEPLGGRSVMQLGLLDEIDCAIGMHVNPEIPSGCFAVLEGPVTKSSDEFRVIFHGKASHAAWPELGVDAITMACAYVSDVQKLISRESHADDGSTISIGRFHGGEATNIVCDRVQIDGTLRTRSPEARSALAARLRDIAGHVAAIHRGRAEFSLTQGEPAVLNDAAMTRQAAAGIFSAFGPNALIPTRPLAGADDFGFYAQTVPSVYFWVGCHDRGGGNITHVHTPEFGVSDDDTLRAARAAWAIVRQIQTSGGPNA